MQSKKSCFNGPVFRKNLTRFAPAWILYTLCLILGMTLLYTDSMEIDTRIGEGTTITMRVSL